MGGSASTCGRCGTSFQSEHALAIHLETCAVLLHVKGTQLNVKATGDTLVKTVECISTSKFLKNDG
jgi:hypothetical protein